jgi:hypothetical protein
VTRWVLLPEGRRAMMTRFYDLAARLSGMAAVVCAVLALLGSPAVSHADDLNCWDMCMLNYPPDTKYDDYMMCSADCGIQGLQCPSVVQNGKYIGCKDAGLQCSVNGKAGTCGDALSKNACNCNQVKTP